jgi:L-ascorbate metabolism protein UlaG (beta-lactamase superfamily)
MPENGTITWLGHATLRLNLPDGRVILIDPWLKENPSCPEDEKEQTRCDMILLTHAHGDHTGDIPALIAQHKPKIVAIYELAGLIQRKYPGAEMLPMSIGGTQDVDGVKVSLTRAYHSSSLENEKGFEYAGMPAGVVVNVEGLANLYHAGDTDVFTDMQLIRRFHEPKIAALPIGDLFTMGPKGAALAAEWLKPNAIIPIHYGTFPPLTGTPSAFKSELGPNLSPNVLVPKAGQPMTWNHNNLRIDSE